MMVWPLRTQFRMMKYKDGKNEDGAIPSLLETFFLILATPLAFHIKAVLIPMVDKIPAGSKKKSMPSERSSDLAIRSFARVSCACDSHRRLVYIDIESQLVFSQLV